MGQIIVRNLDDAVIQRLKERARLAQTSLEQTVRNILSDAAEPDDAQIWADIDRIRERIGKIECDLPDPHTEEQGVL